MVSQREHLEALHPAYQNVVELIADITSGNANTEENKEKVNKELLKLGLSIQGLDLRLLNDDLAARISEGSSRAVGALASKYAPTTLHNRTAANSIDGVLIDNALIIRLFESIDFYESDDMPGRSTNVLFNNCLDMLTRMFAGATFAENNILRDLAERVMMPDVKS